MPPISDQELIRKTAAINYEIVISHGVSDAGVGFDWNGSFIHDPFTDPQYGAFPVDPAQQYGDAYTGSIFVTDPVYALQMAQRQLREKTNEDLSRYCVEHELDAAAVIEAACGLRVVHSVTPLEILTDDNAVDLVRHIPSLPTSAQDGNLFTHPGIRQELL